MEQGFHEYIASWHEHGLPWELSVGQYEAARVQFAAFIGATAEEVAIIPYASAGTNSVASAAQLRELISGKRVSSLERPHERVESPRT